MEVRSVLCARLFVILWLAHRRFRRRRQTGGLSNKVVEAPFAGETSAIISIRDSIDTIFVLARRAVGGTSVPATAFFSDAGTTNLTLRISRFDNCFFCLRLCDIDRRSFDHRHSAPAQSAGVRDRSDRRVAPLVRAVAAWPPARRRPTGCVTVARANFKFQSMIIDCACALSCSLIVASSSSRRRQAPMFSSSSSSSMAPRHPTTPTYARNERLTVCVSVRSYE